MYLKIICCNKTEEPKNPLLLTITFQPLKIPCFLNIFSEEMSQQPDNNQFLLLLQALLNQQNQTGNNSNPPTDESQPNAPQTNTQQFIGPQGNPISMEEMMNLIDQEGYTGGTRAASRHAIENLEEREITKKDVQDEKKCGICLEDFEVGSWVKLLPCRKHLFCDLCILEWLKKNNTWSGYFFYFLENNSIVT